jgi:metallo-beta-lactamase class B
MSDRIRWSLSCLIACGMFACVPYARAQGTGQSPAKPDSLQVLAGLEKAKALAGTMWALEQHVTCDGPEVPPAADPGPQRLFDNLYAIPGPYSRASGVIYLITTSAGIIQIDSGRASDIETVYLPGMKKLGLDPVDVKVVIIGHGHQDHFGGARYMQDHYGSHVYLSAADWAYMQLTPPPAQGQTPALTPKLDMFAVEGQPIVLGDGQVTPVLIPAHTPGALGLIFPVKDGGKPHMVGIVGGGMGPQGTSDQMRLFINSLQHFQEWTNKMNVDVELQNHPIMDGFGEKLIALRARKRGDPNPFVVGTEGYSRFLEVMRECTQVGLDRSLQ